MNSQAICITSFLMIISFQSASQVLKEMKLFADHLETVSKNLEKNVVDSASFNEMLEAANEWKSTTDMQMTLSTQFRNKLNVLYNKVSTLSSNNSISVLKKEIDRLNYIYSSIERDIIYGEAKHQ